MDVKNCRYLALGFVVGQNLSAKISAPAHDMCKCEKPTEGVAMCPKKSL